jgi:subtilase family serine protease
VRRCLLISAVVALVGAVTVAVPGAGAATGPTHGLLPLGCANPAGHTSLRLLPPAPSRSGQAVTCFGSVVLGSGSMAPHASAGPVGYGPPKIQSAYRLSGKNAHGRTVAVIDAYDDPKAESDLAVYRRTYGLPACTSTNHCFRKLNQHGATRPLPARDYGWAGEISLDLDAVSAACPTCQLLLVEASSAFTSDLMAAVDTAVRAGASAVSISWGGAESHHDLVDNKHLNHPGVAIAAASGDAGYGVQWPAASPYVTAVGGTTLRASATSRGWTETAWHGAGSGCSRYESKPSWQHDTGCRRRTVADVSAVADPSTGLGVYDTFNSCFLAVFCDTLLRSGLATGLNGWVKIGGTSLAAPIVAAIYALAGNRKGTSYLYAHRSSLNDVRSGANSRCGSYLCTARIGYDGPTGLGTPNGLGAF